MCELAKLPVLVEYKGIFWSPTPSTASEDGELIDWEIECFLHVLFPCTESVSPSTTLLESAFPPCPESPVCPLVPPSSDSSVSSEIPPPHPKPPILSALPPMVPSSSILGYRSRGSASVLRALDSTSAFRPIISSLAPSPLLPPWLLLRSSPL